MAEAAGGGAAAPQSFALKDVVLEERIGAGSDGEVWAAVWSSSSTTESSPMGSSADGLAVKVAHQQRNDRFIAAELELLRSVRHRNLVGFVGYCSEARALLLELCLTSLFSVLHRSQFRPPRCEMLRTLRETASGLAYLHSLSPPVAHLDVKSANVLIDSRGTAKLCDFCHSCRLPSDQSAAPLPSHVEAHALGSPCWAAPELLRGEACHEKADVYSYGIVLFEVVACRLPYSGLSDEQLIAGVMACRLPRPQLDASEEAAWPSEVVALMHSCLLEKPAERPSCASILKRLPRSLARMKSSASAQNLADGAV